MNTYLDPKNDYLIEKDKSKISLVRSQNNVDLRIVTEQSLSNVGEFTSFIFIGV